MFDSFESTSHAFLGHSKDEDVSHHSPWERATAHLVGYISTPLKWGFEQVVGSFEPSSNGTAAMVEQNRKHFREEENLSRSRVSSTAFKKQISFLNSLNRSTMPPKGKKKTIKKQVKKQVKQQVKQAVRQTIPRAPRQKMYRRFTRRATNARRQMNLGRRSNLIKSSASVPTYDAVITNSGPAMYFFEAGPGCMGMGGTIRMGTFSSNSSGQISLATSGGATIASTIPIAPQLVGYSTPTFSTLCSLFERYKIRTSLRYIPCCPTTTSGRIAVCHLEDPGQVYSVFGISTNISPAVFGDVTSVVNVVEFPVISRASTKTFGSRSSDDMKYVAGDFVPSDTTTMNWTAEPTILREQIQGVWMFSYANATPSVTLGDLFMNFEIILCNMTLAPTLTPTLRARDRARQKKLVDAIPSILTRLGMSSIDDEKEKVLSPPPVRSSSSLGFAVRSVPSEVEEFSLLRSKSP